MDVLQSNPEAEVGAALWARRLLLLTTGVGLGVSVIVISMDVVLRYVFHAPLEWGLELNGVLLAIVAFGAFPATWERRAHIRLGFSDQISSDAVRRTFAAIAAICMSVTWAGIAWALIILAREMLKYGPEPEYLAMPYWPIAAFMAAISGICAIQSALFLLSTFTQGGPKWTR